MKFITYYFVLHKQNGLTNKLTNYIEQNSSCEAKRHSVI